MKRYNVGDWALMLGKEPGISGSLLLLLAVTGQAIKEYDRPYDVEDDIPYEQYVKGRDFVCCNEVDSFFAAIFGTTGIPRRLADKLRHE